MARLTIADISRLPLPGMDAPGSVAFTPDGSALTYLQSGDRSLVRSLWRHDLATGERTVLAGPEAGALREEALSHEERLRRERTRTSELGVTEYAWARHGATLVAPMAGRVHVMSGDGAGAAAGTLVPLPGIERAACAVPSPDGSRVALVVDGDVWVADVGPDLAPDLAANAADTAEAAAGGGWLRRLTHDAEPGVTNGLAEYIAAEELDRFAGLWWSTEGTRLAVARVDERGVPPFVIGHLGDEAPAAEDHRYPFAGGPNAAVTLRIVRADARGQPVDVDLGMAPGDYLARVVATPAGSWLVAVLPRDQRTLRWLRLDPDARVAPLWVESADPWINLDEGTWPLGDGRVLRATEATGHRHLELRRPDGTLERRLTAGPWDVTGIAHVDEERGTVLFVATRDGVRERHAYEVALDAGAPATDPERLTVEPGWHDVAVSRDGRVWADTWSDLEHAPRTVVHRRDGDPPVPVHQPTMSAASAAIRPPQLLDLLAADGTTPLHAAYYPPADAGGGPRPCVVWVYGGPHAQYVKNAWELSVHPLRRYLAQAGAGVLVVDNRGSASRGLEFEAPLRGRLGGVEVDDQAAALREVAARGLVDSQRVAITGGSYGGFMTIMAMLREPDLFRVGVAVAPVTDWRGYDTAYAERYLGMPDAELEAYRRSSPLDAAAGLRGGLLLIHGALDENVHLRHSVRLVGRLQAAGIDVELVILPHDRHRARSAMGLQARDRRTVRHLLTGLGLALPEELAAPGGEVLG